jgi:hypothetical protein
VGFAARVESAHGWRPHFPFLSLLQTLSHPPTLSRARRGADARAQQIDYPALLDFPAPRLLAYTPESSIAEKFEAMVVLDMANTRMKDFLDIWTLAQGRRFAGEPLSDAVDATFRRRGTSLPTSTPVALTPAFHSARAKQAQWAAFLRKARVDVPTLEPITQLISIFLMPVVAALLAGTALGSTWSPGGPWRDR